jgi:hypothetical protein
VNQCSFSRKSLRLKFLWEQAAVAAAQSSSNPFSLMLLADLVEQEVEAARSSTVRTQVGLLDLYWKRARGF